MTVGDGTLPSFLSGAADPYEGAFSRYFIICFYNTAALTEKPLQPCVISARDMPCLMKKGKQFSMISAQRSWVIFAVINRATLRLPLQVDMYIKRKVIETLTSIGTSCVFGVLDTCHNAF